MEEKKGRFCMAPFVALNTRGHGNLRICCSILGMPNGLPKQGTLDSYPGNALRFLSKNNTFDLNKDSIATVWNSEFLRDFRLKMLRGEYIPNCSHCHLMEDSGLSSKRLSKNKRFLNGAKELLAEVEKRQGHMDALPRWWEIRLSTKCNLGCRMCSPVLSTRLLREYTENYKTLDQEKKDHLKNTDELETRGYLAKSDFFREQLLENLEHVEYLEMRGGEVLFDKDAVNFVGDISLRPAAQKIHFDLSSNIMPLTEAHIAMFNRFGGGHFRSSIDAFAEENEYIRYGTKWTTIQEKLRLQKKLHRRWVKIIQVTLTAYQVCTIDRLLWFFDHFMQSEEVNFFFGFSLVRDMPHLVPEIIPLSLRLESAKRVEAFLNTSFLCQKSPNKETHQEIIRGLISALQNKRKPPAEAFPKFIEHTLLLDRIRQQSVLRVFPHLEFIFQPAAHAEAAWN